MKVKTLNSTADPTIKKLWHGSLLDQTDQMLLYYMVLKQKINFKLHHS